MPPVTESVQLRPVIVPAAVFTIPVRVQAVLAHQTMTVSELLALHEGSVISLDRQIGELVEIFVNDRLIGRGDLVRIEDDFGVTLTDLVLD